MPLAQWARKRRWPRSGGALVAATLVLVLATSTALVGCSDLAYLSQSVTGHAQLLARSHPLDDVLGGATTPEALRERLQLAQRLRDFAVQELALPDNASYRRYADLGRPYAVWNVVVAPELSLRLQTWCFPVVGCVAYRGYYSFAAAQEFATELRAANPGLEVVVQGIPAYSTLGKLPFDALADPLLNTFIYGSDADLARLIFHELAHQVAFAPGDTEFNESFATAVEQAGLALWLQQRANDSVRAAAAAEHTRREDFRRFAADWRTQLDAIYRLPLPDAEKRERKAALRLQKLAEYADIKTQRWAGFAGYDAWVARANNAALGILAAYDGDVPAFIALRNRLGGDWQRFYAEVQRLSKLPFDQRHTELAANRN